MKSLSHIIKNRKDNAPNKLSGNSLVDRLKNSDQNFTCRGAKLEKESKSTHIFIVRKNLNAKIKLVPDHVVSSPCIN